MMPIIITSTAIVVVSFQERKNMYPNTTTIWKSEIIKSGMFLPKFERD